MQRHCVLKLQSLWGFECPRLVWRSRMVTESDGTVSRLHRYAASGPVYSAMI